MKDFLLDKWTRRDFLENAAKLCFLAGVSALFPGCGKTEPLSDAPKTELETEVKIETLATPTGDFEPAYLKLHRTGELKERAEELWAVMESCQLCPRTCGANRLEGASGFCRAPGATLVVSASHAHFGEERPLVGRGGSGTIFLTHCNLRCVFCQNWSISHLGRGYETDIDGLAVTMLQLQRNGCHNINVVTPTHYSPHILKAIDLAATHGLRLPIVYNTSGWERMEILAFLDGVVDIYLPDFKYWDSAMASKYSAEAESYPEMTSAAILEMHRQVGVAHAPPNGIMQRGLMIRHLVMPGNVSGSEDIMAWIAANLPRDTYVNIMAQYTPAHKAYDYTELSRRITAAEYQAIVEKAQVLGLTNLDIQGQGWLQR